MEGSPGPSDLRKQLKQREAEVGALRDRLRESLEEIDRLRRENEELRKELKAAGRGKKSQGQSIAEKEAETIGPQGRQRSLYLSRRPGGYNNRLASAASAGDDHPMPVLRGRFAVRTD